MLLDADNGWEQTAAAAGIGISQVHDLVTGRQKRISRVRAAHIMTLRPTPLDHVIIDATGSRRRLQTLAAAGHGFKAVGAAAGINISVVSDLICGNVTRIRRGTAKAITRAYEQMSATTGGSVRNINRARREGWAVPAAWDGIDMDDPDAFPDITGHCGTLKGRRLHKTCGIPICDPCRNAKAEGARERPASRAAERQAVAS